MAGSFVSVYIPVIWPKSGIWANLSPNQPSKFGGLAPAPAICKWLLHMQIRKVDMAGMSESSIQSINSRMNQSIYLCNWEWMKQAGRSVVGLVFDNTFTYIWCARGDYMPCQYIWGHYAWHAALLRSMILLPVVVVPSTQANLQLHRANQSVDMSLVELLGRYNQNLLQWNIEISYQKMPIMLPHFISTITPLAIHCFYLD